MKSGLPNTFTRYASIILEPDEVGVGCAVIVRQALPVSIRRHLARQSARLGRSAN